MSHVEKAPHYLWMKIFLGIISMYFVGMTYYVYLSEPSIFPIMLGACVLIIWGFTSFFTMRYEIHDDKFVAVMWPFKNKILFSEMKDVRLEKIPWWAGMGYHLLWKRAFINSVYGTGIVIEKKNGSSLTITPHDPEDFVTMLPKNKIIKK